MSLRKDIDDVAGGWRWTRRSILPEKVEPPAAREKVFPTAWARTGAGRIAREIIHATGFAHLTRFEVDIVGFNVVTLDSKGNVVQLNPALIRCEECVTGLGHRYDTIIPKHKGGHDIFLETLRVSGAFQVNGPAIRDCTP